MEWLKAALALLTLLNKVLTLAQSYKDSQAGRAAAILEATAHVTAMVDQASKLRADAAARDADPSRLREADKYSRT